MRIAKQNVPFVWALDKRDDVWKYGASSDGMGVFEDFEVPGDPTVRKWYGNIVIPGAGSIFGMGPFDSMDEAMKECEVWYLRLQASLEVGS